MPTDEIKWPGGRSRHEMVEILERNGCLGGASDILSGDDPAAALAPYRGQTPQYDDAEGIWVQAWIDELRTPAEAEQESALGASANALARRAERAPLAEVLSAPRRLRLVA